MEQERELIYLAALLHDIGKFYQRADKSFGDVQAQLSMYSKRLANDICPVNDFGKFGYQHVVWTNEFLKKVQEKLGTLTELKVNLYETKNEDNLANLACNHHQPNSILQSIITMADWWSSGIDRRKPIEKDEAEDTLTAIDWGKTRYKQIPLYSIFNAINNGKGKHAFPLEPLDISNSLFPKAIEKKEDGVSQAKYKALWDKFIVEFEKLPSDSLNGFTESLIYLLKKYTWCIPSNTMDMANVSLFDHLKSTAAFSDCIYSYYTENEKDFKWNPTDKKLTLIEGKYPVILLGCDISGIQKFIYNIASRKAATSLKGRSFYLQLMIDSIIQRIISHKDIHATIGHIVYSSGGKFYMLLPNTEKVKTAINELYKEIESEIWNEHKGKLIINLDYIPFAFRSNTKEIDFEGNNNLDKNLGSLWKVLADKLTERKNRKFQNILENNFDHLFTSQAKGGNVKVCAVTGEELKEGEYDQINNSETIVSKAVMKQIELGETLKDIDYIITYKGHNEYSTYLSNRSKINTTIFSLANYMFDQSNPVDDKADISKITSADISRVKRINDTNFLATSLKGQRVSYGFQFYGGNKQAEFNDKRDKTFEDLTRVEKEGITTETYFGVLRMDVDGLGVIFIKGLSETNKTFSAYATLSSSLDWFFSGYLNTIREKYKDNVNILYSGGDDVFAVGRWDLLLSFAEDIRNGFRKYVGREDISISAGITIVGNKYPIAKAAQLAGEALDEAKKCGEEKAKKIPAKKNAINFLGQTVSWEEEFDWVKLKKTEFVCLINNGKGMSKGILHRIMLFAEIQANNKLHQGKTDKNGKLFVPDLSYYWNSAYYLKRFMEGKNDEVVAFCKTLQTDVINPRKLELIALASRWAELELKENIK